MNLDISTISIKNNSHFNYSIFPRLYFDHSLKMNKNEFKLMEKKFAAK